MTIKEIELNYNRKDFEEIYFSNGKGRIFFNRRLTRQFYTSTALGVILILILIYNFIESKYYGFGVIALFAFSLALMDLYRSLLPLIKWKKQVKIYLNDLAKIKKNKIILTDELFSLEQDEKITIEKWSAFTKAEIHPNHIILISSTNWSIPKKSMTEQEFNFLKEVVYKKIQRA